MTLDQDKLAASAKGFKALFFEALRKEPGMWSQLVMEVPCEGGSNEYDWLGGAPAVEEWASGNRPMGSLKAYNYTVADQTWANGLRVKRKHVEDDRLGLYKPAIRQLAQNFDLAKSKLLFQTKLANGFTAAQGSAYDGQFFFDTDHLDNEETAQSNKVTTALSATAFETGVQAMMRFTDDRGEYLNIYPTHLVVPPQLRATAKRILGQKITLEAGGSSDAGVSNINEGEVELMVVPWLAGSATAWFLADLSKEIKPFIFQPRMPVEFVAKTRPDDDNVFAEDELHYGGRERYTIAFGAWQTMYGSTGAG